LLADLANQSKFPAGEGFDWLLFLSKLEWERAWLNRTNSAGLKKMLTFCVILFLVVWKSTHFKTIGGYHYFEVHSTEEQMFNIHSFIHSFIHSW